MINQLPSLIGAALVLSAYFGSQIKWISEESKTYQALNFFGAGILTINAWMLNQYGFVLMNGAWVVITCISMLKKRG